jgi:hypothetical protein
MALLLGGLILLSLARCTQLVTTTTTVEATLPATTSPELVVTSIPTVAPEPTNITVAALSQTETPSNQSLTPATGPKPQPSLTAIPLTPAEVIQEPKMTNPVTSLPTPSDPGLQHLISQAQEDLAKRLNIAIQQVVLIEIKYVTWPDKGLGCPKPGIAYPQVPQDGMVIKLSAGKRIYNYHVGLDRPPFWCEQSKE